MDRTDSGRSCKDRDMHGYEVKGATWSRAEQIAFNGTVIEAGPVLLDPTTINERVDYALLIEDRVSGRLITVLASEVSEYQVLPSI